MKKKFMAKGAFVFGGALFILLFFAFWISKTELSAKLPPLIDREVFFGNAQISGAQISPSGTYIAFIKPYENVPNIWVKRTDEPFSRAHPVTQATDRPISGCRWSRDEKCILFLKDTGGNENFHLFAVDPEGELPPRDLTPFDTVTAGIICLPKCSPNIVYVALNDRDVRYHDVYQIDLLSGERLLVRENKEAIASHVFDLSGNLRLALRMTPEGGAEILRIDGVFLQRIWACSEKERVHCFGFHKDGRQCYLSTNAGSDVDLERLVLLDVETGEVEEVESDPEQEVDFNAPIFSRKTEELIGTSYVGDRLRTYFTDEEWDRDYQILKTKWPWQEIVIPSMTDDDSLCIVGVSSDVDPATVYLFDRKTKKIEFLYKARPLLPIDHLASMTPVVYTARDGLTIHGYLTIPRGVEPRNLPLVAFPHGGPWSRDTWGYNAYAQLLANRGYAVLQMNFRGSTGYGKKFLNAGNKEWGDAMQNDITDGVLHLISKQIADPKKVAIFGASYGGYASLAGLAFTPDVYAAGISFVGPSNLLTLLRTLPPYWSSVKAHTYNAVGDPMIPEDLERLRRQSPLFSAANITAPLLVIQGANDPRVKKAESDQIVASLHQLGREVEYIVAPDEGHGFARAENRIAAAVAIEKFLAKHLGGRFQESISSAVSERLRELTVDVDSVEMPVAVQEGY